VRHTRAADSSLAPRNCDARAQSGYIKRIRSGYLSGPQKTVAWRPHRRAKKSVDARHQSHLPLLLSALIFVPSGTSALAQTNETTKAAPLTEQDTVVLADFDNKTTDTVLDDALKQALAVELGQSPFLNILPDRKVSETLRILGRPADARVSSEVAREVCLRTGSKAVLRGTISSRGGHYLLDLMAVACSSGQPLAKAQGEAAGRRDILKALNQAASGLRMQLGESMSSVQKFDTPIEVTTSSLEALKEFRTGITVQREQGDTRAISFFKQAIRLDPDFPMAYAMLAAIYRNLQQPSLALRYATKAYQLRARVSEREKLHISGTYFLTTGELEKEIRTYEAWESDYPRDVVPHNNLGNDYAAVGQLEKALAEYRQAQQLMPSVISYTNVAGMDLSLNRLDAAAATLDEAFGRGLDGRYLRQTLYWLAFLHRDVALMDKQVAWASGKAGDEDALLSMKSDTEAYYGRVTASRDFTSKAVASAVHAGAKESAALWQVNAALREAEVGNTAAARQGVTAALALSSGRDVKLTAAFTLARAGDASGARALTNELEKAYSTDSLMKLYWMPTIRAAINLDGSLPSQALKDLQAAAPYELGGAGTFINYVYPAYVRGQAQLLAHNASAAAAEFHKLLDHSGIVVNFLTGALAELQLGRAYAMGGETTNAKAAYQDFLTLWRDADADTPILEEAKREFAALQLTGSRETPIGTSDGARPAQAVHYE
jgi:eukaryotic-like serine/threonine-protein kinase